MRRSLCTRRHAVNRAGIIGLTTSHVSAFTNLINDPKATGNLADVENSGNAGGYDGYKPLVLEICKFFKTGQPPVSMEETLEIYTFMEAADESKRQGGEPVSMDEVFQKAQAARCK
jgi:hypothetical protein